MGLRLHKPGRRVILSVIVVLIGILGVGGYLLFGGDDSKEPKTAAEAVADDPMVSSPTDGYINSLKTFAEKTDNISEKYKAYSQLCNAYSNINNLKSAVEYCDKALAIADKAKVSADDKKTLENLKNYIAAKMETAEKDIPSNPSGYVEPKE